MGVGERIIVNGQRVVMETTDGNVCKRKVDNMTAQVLEKCLRKDNNNNNKGTKKTKDDDRHVVQRGFKTDTKKRHRSKLEPVRTFNAAGRQVRYESRNKRHKGKPKDEQETKKKKETKTKQFTRLPSRHMCRHHPNPGMQFPPHFSGRQNSTALRPACEKRRKTTSRKHEFGGQQTGGMMKA